MSLPKNSLWIPLVIAFASIGVGRSAEAGDDKDKNEIKKVDFADEGQSTTIHIRGSDTPTFTVYKLERPNRVVIDVAGAELGKAIEKAQENGATIQVGSWAVSQVAAYELDDGGALVRVVVTLAHPGRYDVEAKGNELIVSVVARDPAPEKVDAEALAEAKAAAEQAKKDSEAAKSARTKAEGDAAKAKEQADAAKAEAAKAKQALKDAKSKSDSASKADKEKAAKELAAAKAEAERAAKALEAAQKDADKTKQAVANAKAEAERTKEAAELAKQQVEQMAAELETAKAEAKAAKAESKKRAKQADDAQRDADAARNEADDAKAEAARVKKDAAADKEEAARAKKDAEADKAEAARAKKAAAQDKEEAARAKKAAAQDQQDAAAAKAEAEQQKKEAAAAKAEAEQQKKEAAAAKAEAQQQKKEAAAAKAEAQRQKQETAEAVAEAERLAAEAKTARADAKRARADADAAQKDAKQKKAAADAAEKEARAQREAAELARDEAAAHERDAQTMRAEAEAMRDDAKARLAAAEAEAKAAKQSQKDAVAAQQKAEAAEAKAQETADAAAAERKAAKEALAAAEKAKAEGKKDADTKVKEAEARLAKAEKARTKAEDARKSAEHAAEDARDEAARRKAETEDAVAARAAAEDDKKAAEGAAAEAKKSAARAEELRIAEAEAAKKAAAAKEAVQDAERAQASKKDLEAKRAEAAKLEKQAKKASKKRQAEEDALAALVDERRRAQQELDAAKVARAEAEEATRAAKLAKADAEADAAQAKKDAAAARKDAEVARKDADAAKQDAEAAKKAKRTAQADEPAPAKKKAPEKKKKAPKTVAVEGVAYQQDGDDARVIVELAGKAEAEVISADAHGAELVISGAELPDKLQKKMDVRKFDGAVRAVSTFRDPDDATKVHVVVEISGDASPRLERVGEDLHWHFAGAAVAQATPKKKAKAKHKTQDIPAPVVGGYGATSSPVTSTSVAQAGGGKRRVYHGPAIDLDFKDADIHNLLRFLANIGRVSIVVPDDIKATVTVRLKKVPWDQALEVILESKGLWYRKTGNLYRIDSRTVLDEEDQKEAERIRAAIQAEAPEAEVFTLNYASAAETADKLEPLLSPKGRIEVDTRTNSLIINDIKAHRRRVVDLAARLDTQTPQIMIEARIVEARSTYAREIGIQWGGSANASQAGGNATGLIFPNSIGLAGGGDDRITPGAGVATPTDFAVNLPATVGTGQGGAIGLSLGSVGGNLNINLRLSALEDQGTVRIISQPKITVLNNSEAEISQGVSIPISVVSAQGTQTQFVPADLALTVTPYVSQRDCSIAMDVKVTKNEPDFVNTGARGDPTILRKEAHTKILVADGETTVMGGITTRNTGLSYNKVPFFGDLPVVGWLFKHRRENDDRTELLVFITPKITNRGFLTCE